MFSVMRFASQLQASELWIKTQSKFHIQTVLREELEEHKRRRAHSGCRSCSARAPGPFGFGLRAGTAQAWIPCTSEAGRLPTLYPSFSFLALLPSVGPEMCQDKMNVLKP